MLPDPLRKRKFGPAGQVDLVHGTKDVLAHVHGPEPWSRFRSAVMVGTGRNHSNFYPELVDSLAQRLVLNVGQVGNLRGVANPAGRLP